MAPTELENRLSKLPSSASSFTIPNQYKRTEDIAKSNVWTADFETSSLPNYEKFGRVHVFLWSLVNCDTHESRFGQDMESFLNTVKGVKAKIVYFP